MVANLVENEHVANVANLCFRNAMSSSGRNINKIMSEYKLDYRPLQLPLCCRTFKWYIGFNYSLEINGFYKPFVHDNATLKYVSKLACRNPMSVSGRNWHDCINFAQDISMISMNIEASVWWMVWYSKW